MKTLDRTIRYLLVVAVLTMISCSSTAVLKKIDDNNWLSIFNGKDLTGWTQLGGKANYQVIKGEIIGTTVSSSPNSFLATNKKYKDFILEFEFNIDASMNSGVQFRSDTKPDVKNGKVHGYQFELDPSERAWTAGIYDESRRGWLYPLTLNPAAKKTIRGRTWYAARIECIDNEIKTFLNGQAMAHLIDVSEIPQRGFIALQVHSIKNTESPGKTIHWRNIRITEDVLKHRLRATSNIHIKKMVSENQVIKP